ncbi:hypothetical protein GHK92_15655 [Nocardioides sp. dk4132]|uniref:hypothetical protein n=1 Tax=unclassified Nocardioides TaxID=2615069 RepID=UPI0012967A59|nr:MULTISPECIES: hypothetical protein [unclassified Nocardioides]MQW77309.1 hypothetical protein [Nocardioides sp. dk4132]
MKMIATYRAAGETLTEGRELEIERDDYDGCWAVARAEVRDGEQLIYIRVEQD